MRILARIVVYGTKSEVEDLLSINNISNWQVMQLGLRRKIPDIDSWCASSERYEFDFYALSDQLLEFLQANENTNNNLYFGARNKINESLLSICVTDQDGKEKFSTIFDNSLLYKISKLGLSLEISHEELMPKFPRWKNIEARLGRIESEKTTNTNTCKSNS